MILVEKSLLTGVWHTSESSPASDLSKLAVDGSFQDVFKSPLAHKIVSITKDKIITLPVDSSDNPEEYELTRLTVAIACLHAFAQANWTGPDLTVTPLDLLLSPDASKDNDLLHKLNEQAISELAYGGEPAYHLVQHPLFLRLAQILLEFQYLHHKTASWWRLRLHLLHQQVLDEPVPLHDDLMQEYQLLADLFSSDPELSGRIFLEVGLLNHQFSLDKQASENFIRAAQATGLEYELTGALGKRTKFQTQSISQLVLLAQSKLPAEPSTPIEPTTIDSITTQLPETLALNDDTLFEHTVFTSSNLSTLNNNLRDLNPSSQPALHPLDQCILLALCLNVRNTSPVHGLTSEQMGPYVNRVISHPRNWSVHTMALLLRSRLESTRTRTVERATLQLQALIDQMPTNDSSVPERLLYFHDIIIPSKWELQRELANQFLSIGVVRSALEIFERLEMWEEVVKCWVTMENVEKGRIIVRDLLEGQILESDAVISRGKTITDKRRHSLNSTREAKLWCLMGDLDPDHAVEHYLHAWEISKHSSGRAMRSLGGYYFARGEYRDAMECLTKAVAINPLLSRSWFILGCAAMRLEEWDIARNAFGRCVAINEEDSESWNNLASMYLRMGTPKSSSSGASKDDRNAALIYNEESSKSVPFANKMLAFRALKQGLKFNYENWRMWSNYMVVSIDVGELAEATRALGRVVELTVAKAGANSVDEDVLERLVGAVIRAPANPDDAVEPFDANAPVFVNPNEGHGLFILVSRLFENTILPHVSSPRVFRAYARLLSWQSRWADALKASLDGYRCSIAGAMQRGETDVDHWREAVNEVDEIVDILRNYGDRVDGYNWKLQARSIVRTFAGRTKENFEDESEWRKIQELQEELRKEDE